jgi:hypothetical protein
MPGSRYIHGCWPERWGSPSSCKLAGGCSSADPHPLPHAALNPPGVRPKERDRVGPLLLVRVSGSKPSDSRCDRVADWSGLDAEPSLGFRAVDNEWLRELVQHLVEFAKCGVEHTHQTQQESWGYADLERRTEFRGDLTDDLAGDCCARGLGRETPHPGRRRECRAWRGFAPHLG